MKKTFLILCLTLISVYAKSEDFVKNEKDGFTWILHMEDSVAEARDADGNVIIPADRGYRTIFYIAAEKVMSTSVIPSFIVSYESDSIPCGICTKDGTEALPPIFKEVCGLKHKKTGYYVVKGMNDLYGSYDEKGRMIVMPRYTSMVTLFRDKFTVVGDITYMPVSNTIEEYYTQQDLLNAAYENGVNTDDLMQEAYQLEEQGEFKKAVGVLSKAIALKPSSFAYYHRGLCHFKNKNWKKAQEDLRYVFFLDDATPGLMVKADSVLVLADDEQMGKRERQIRRLDTWNMVLGAISDGMQKASESLNASNGYHAGSVSQPISGTSGYSGTGYSNGANNNSSQSKSSTSSTVRTKRCTACGGDGKCRGSHRCHGTGKCNYCNGKGITQVQGNTIKCAVCNGSGRCSFCNGTGRCSRCGGRGEM